MGSYDQSLVGDYLVLATEYGALKHGHVWLLYGLDASSVRRSNELLLQEGLRPYLPK